MYTSTAILKLFVALLILGTYITNFHFLLVELGLEKFTHSNSNVVVVIDSFLSDKYKGKVVNQSHK